MERNTELFHPEEVILHVFKQDRCGGYLKPICNRRMEGYKCRCYVRYVEIDNIQYWKIYYLINQRPVYDDDFRPLVRKMYNMVRTVISILESRGVQIVIFRNFMKGDK